MVVHVTRKLASEVTTFASRSIIGKGKLNFAKEIFFCIGVIPYLKETTIVSGMLHE